MIWGEFSSRFCFRDEEDSASVMRKIASYLTKNRSETGRKIAQSTHENEYIKPEKTFCRNSKQFLNTFYGVFKWMADMRENGSKSSPACEGRDCSVSSGYGLMLLPVVAYSPMSAPVKPPATSVERMSPAIVPPRLVNEPPSVA